MAELIKLSTKTRGRNSREVEYEGVGRVVKATKEGEEDTIETSGVLTSVADALNLVEGNEQRLLDLFAIGYNKFQRDAALDVDEFAEFVDPSWDEKKADAFKRSVRALAKVAEMDIADAAQLVLGKMNKS
jgi:hypothetical protein